MKWGEKPYYSLDYYLKTVYGKKYCKIALDAGFTCPNRDGKVGWGGCAFCSAGSGRFTEDCSLSVSDQIEQGIAHSQKAGTEGFIAYYQAYTNTYADISYLKKVFEPAFSDSRISLVSIATRPDCLSEACVSLLKEYQKRKPIWIELGLQTIHEETAEKINRGYSLSVFTKAVKDLKAAGIDVIVHVILGLPGETENMILQTIDYLNTLEIQGIKLQLLHVLKETALADWYREGFFQTYTLEEYVKLVCLCVGHLSGQTVIHRITGDGPRDEVLAPLWSIDKRRVLNAIHHELKLSGIYQGCLSDHDESRSLRRDKNDIGTNNTV